MTVSLHSFLFFYWVSIILLPLGNVSSFAQIDENNQLVFNTKVVQNQGDSIIQLSIEGINNSENNVFAFATEENFSGFNSQISSQIPQVEIVAIHQEEAQFKKINVPNIDQKVTVYKNQKINFDVTVRLKDFSALPKVFKLDIVAIFNKDKDLGSYISTVPIFKKEIDKVGAFEKEEQLSSNVNKLSLWKILILSFLGGLIALLTPCIYAVIPLTVSFFIKKSTSSRQAIKNSLIYSSSIIVIFSLLGVLFTLIFGPTALNFIATSSIANLIFFVIFLIFALSFFGAFEITLPASWSTSTSKFSERTDFVGIFFMALTLVIVSFSCTGPIIGSLIVIAAQGSLLSPLVGIFGFSLALAIPFFFFSVFPTRLEKITKSGSWLNAVKVVLGFLELALALKFLSNADLALGTRLLDREIFISLWIIIFILIGLYLMGAIRFKHDDTLPKNHYGLPYLNSVRLLLIIASWTFVIYLLPGLWGAPLNSVSGFLPPMGTQDFRYNTSISPNTNQRENSPFAEERKYADEMEHFEPDVVKRYKLQTYFDYKQALSVAQKSNMPLMLDFTGVNCINCRKMEAQVWSDPRVARLLRDSFIIASLYIDVHNVYLKKEDISINKAGKEMLTIGEKYASMQIEQFQANVQPYYFFLDKNENRIIQEGYGYDSNIDKFLNHLHKVLSNFHSQ